MFNPSKGRPAGMWNKDFDFTQPVNRVLSPVHQHEFGNGYDMLYKDAFGKVQARLDGLQPEEATFLKMKHKL